MFFVPCSSFNKYKTTLWLGVCGYVLCTRLVQPSSISLVALAVLFKTAFRHPSNKKSSSLWITLHRPAVGGHWLAAACLLASKMRILVAVKRVVDYNARIRVKADKVRVSCGSLAAIDIA